MRTTVLLIAFSLLLAGNALAVERSSHSLIGLGYLHGVYGLYSGNSDPYYEEHWGDWIILHPRTPDRVTHGEAFVNGAHIVFTSSTENPYGTSSRIELALDYIAARSSDFSSSNKTYHTGEGSYKSTEAIASLGGVWSGFTLGLQVGYKQDEVSFTHYEIIQSVKSSSGMFGVYAGLAPIYAIDDTRTIWLSPDIKAGIDLFGANDVPSDRVFLTAGLTLFYITKESVR